MATCTVTGTLVDVSEAGISGAIVKAKLLAPTFSASGSDILPTEISTTTASDGTWSLSLSQGQNVVVSIEYPPNITDSSRRINYTAVVPSSASATFSSIATLVNT